MLKILKLSNLLHRTHSIHHLINTFFAHRFTKDSVFFKGTGGLEKKNYEVTIDLYKEIDPDKSKSFNRERCIEVVLAKANQNDPYWPSLTKDKKKHHWLKIDFNKWNDEDDSCDEGVGGMEGDGDINSMLRQMGGLGTGGDGKPSFDDMALNDEEDSDDEPLPDLE